MEDQQIITAIAEFRGWKFDPEGYWTDPEGNEWQVMFGWQTYKDGSDILPDYANDLNAIHGAEISLSPADRMIFRKHLKNIVLTEKGLIAYGELLCHATARQRAEAFLRTLAEIRP